MKSRMQLIARRALPLSVRRRIVRYTRWPPVGRIDFGNLRRRDPVSRIWGGDRGQPVDRVYIEQFLSEHALDIRGRVLEVSDNAYTRRFGGQRVASSDVLDVTRSNPKATLVADLSAADDVPSDAFDCIICTQTLQYVPDLQAAVHSLHRILKPAGVLLATLPGISQLSRSDMERWGDYWRFTTCSAHWLFGRVFPTADVQVEAHGNVLAAIAFLHGLAAEELQPDELHHRDADYQISITVRAVKSAKAD